MRKIFALLALAVGVRCYGQVSAVPTQQCVGNATQAAVSGLLSTNFQQLVIPSCTVNVVLTGTSTPATYYFSIGGSPQTGPFTASPTGQFLIFASTGVGLDVTLSGGVPPNTYPSPVTFTDVIPGGGGSAVAPPAFAVQFASSPSGNSLSSDQYIQINPASHSFTAPINNGFLEASNHFYNTNGNNGIANASSGATNQTVIADPSYGTTEQPLTSSFSATGLHVSDYRAGSQTDFFHDPGLPWLDQYNSNLAKNLYCLFDSVSSASAALVAHDCWNMTHNDNSPGWNWGSGGVGPDGWLIQSSAVVANNTQNSGNQISFTSNSTTTGLGDRVAGNFLTSSWGGRTGGGDEGAVGLRVQVNEATSYQGLFTAKISSASAPYLTLGLFSAQPFDNFANLGQGQYLIDLGTCSAYPCTAPYTGTAATGVLSMTSGFGVTVATLGISSLPVSNAWGTLQANVAPTQQNTFPFGTSTTFNVVLTSGAVDTANKFCFTSQFHECTIPTAVGTPSGGVQSVTISGRAGHAAGSSWFQGGMAGYVLEPSAYTQFAVYPNALRFPLDVFGSTANNKIVVGSFNSGVVQGGVPIRLATCAITSLTNSGTTVSFTTASSSACTDSPQDNLGLYAGATILITGASDSAFNALCTAMTINSGVTSGTCTIAGLTGSHTSATAAVYLTQNSIASNSFNLWPSVQILDVQDEGASPPAVDGKITIEPTLSFAANDIVEQTHNFAGSYAAETTLTNTQNPFQGSFGISAIVQGPGAVGGATSASAPSMIAAFNNNTDTYYQGYGGINMPENGLTIRGPSNIGINFSDYPITGLINVPGNGLQLNNPNFCESLFALGSRAGGPSNASMSYCPYQNTMSFTSLGGITMISPGGITLSSLAGGGTQCVQVSNAGLLSGAACGSGSFTAGGDLSGTSTSQEVVGILSHTLPSLTSGFLEWTGSTWAFAAGGGGDTITSPNSTLTIGGTSSATTLDVANAATFNNSGSGAASGTSYNGSVARTVSFNTLGAPGLAATTNTFTGTTNDFSGTSQLKLPVGAGYTSAANGECGYDTTNQNWNCWDNGANSLLATFATSGITSGHVAGFLKTSSAWALEDLGALPAGTVTSIATTLPVVGGTITGSGTLSCPTCVVATVNPSAGLLRVAGSTQTATGSELSGDATTSGSNAVTVVQIEGAVIPASTPVIGTNSSKQLIATTPHQLVQPIQCADTSTSATTYTCSTTPAIASLTVGDTFLFTSINQNNSGSSTLNINGIGAKTIKKYQNSGNLASGDLQSAAAVLLTYDGTSLEIDTIGNPPGGGGTVTSIATTAPVGGGTITSSGTITCATCVTSASSLTANEPVVGSGSQGAQTLNLTGFQFDNGTSLPTAATASQLGTLANITATQLLFSAGTSSALAGSANLTWSSPTLTIGASGTAGNLTEFNNTASTTWASAATTSNTILGFATAPVNGDLIGCATSSTTCTLTDEGILASAVVTLTGTQTLTNKTLTSPIMGGTPDGSGATQFKLPVASSFATLANGEIGYDTTNKNWHAWANAVDNLVAVLLASGTYTNGHCAQLSNASSVLTLVDAGSACGSDSGGGTSGWSGTPITFISSTTQYAPPVGGSLTSTTESVADVASPVAQTISNLSVSLSAALGASATLQVTFRDGGVSQALTCTTAAGGASCTDSTHSFNIAKGDLIDFVLVSSGTVTSGVPQIVITYAVGTSSVGVTSIATTGPITGGTITSTGTIACATCVTSAASLTAHTPIVGEGSQTSATIASAGTSGQLLASQGSSTDPHYIDFPERLQIPAANCNNTTAGAGWSIGSGGTVTCRAGTNNLGGYIAITDTSSTFAQFALTIPVDWDTATNPYIKFYFSAVTDTTSGHTVIPQIKVSCPTAGNGTVSDDATFSAAQSSSTVTFGASAVANGFYNGSSVQIGSTQMTGCIAGGLMIVQVGRATDTATGVIGFYSADLTFPRLIAVQAN